MLARAAATTILTEGPPMYQGKLVIKLVGFDTHYEKLIDAQAPKGPLEPSASLLDPALLDKAHAADMLLDADTVLVAVPDAKALPVLDIVIDAVAAAEKQRAERIADINPTSMLHLLPGTDIIVAAPPSMVDSLESKLDSIDDLWPLPPSDIEFGFHVLRYIQHRTRDTNAWQTSQYLEATINSTPSLIWFKTRDGVHEKVNDSFCETVAKTKEQVQGQRHAYIWDVEEDDPACIESENKVMNTERTNVSEESVQTGDGDPRLLTTYKSPLYNIDGSVMGTVGVAIDITQERAYEQSLIEKNHSLEAIFMSLECGVLTHSVDGSHIVSVNQAALNILGYESEEELVADGFNMIASSVLDEDKVRLREAIATLDHIGDSASIEYRVLRPDGTLTYVIGNIKLIEQNGVPLYQRFLLDYSEEKIRQAQKDIRQRDQIRALTENYVAVCAFDLDTDEGEVLRLSSDHAYDFAGVFDADMGFSAVIDAYVGRYVSEQDQESVRAALSREQIIDELERSDRHEIPYRVRQDGTELYFTVTVVRSGSWDNGQNHRIVIGFRNVDRQKREEIERKNMLEDALVRATRASEAKSTFLTNMSHDIRTPLNAIIGFTSLAKSRIDKTELVREYLGKIQTSSEHLLGLINDVLDMSRIESGKTSLDIAPCDFLALIDDLSNVLHSSVAEKGLRLTVDSSGISDGLVLCDKLKVMQVLLNLAGNAIKFTEPGGAVTIEATELPDHSARCRRYRIRVSDTGIGMEADFIEHLFDAFERERTTTISGIQGTGLGMAITKSLVTMMGGTIEVESEKGVGTTFTLSLTFNVADGAEGCGETPTPQPAGQPAPMALDASVRRRLLLVEDNPLNREIALALLDDAGFDVEYACDGQEAIDMLSSADPDHFDAVLMDIQMPRMNGYETATVIRALDDPMVSSIPILAVTADAFDSDRQKALQCGMNGHLSKPFQVDKLLEALGSVLR